MTNYYTCCKGFEVTSCTCPGEAIGEYLDSLYPLDPYEKLPVHVTLYEWEPTGDFIDEGLEKLREVSQEQIHVATWCKENEPDMMKDCVAPGEEGGL